MTVTYFAGRPMVNETYPDVVEHLREVSRAVNRNTMGLDNSSMSVTLTPSAATTTIIDRRISLQTALTLMPTTASAAAALPTTYVVCSKGQAIINHTNSAVVDRIYTVGMQG